VLLFLLQGVSPLNAQAPLLGFGNQMLSFDENTGIVNNAELPVPDIIAGYEEYYFYDGSPATLHQHVQFDDQSAAQSFHYGIMQLMDGFFVEPDPEIPIQYRGFQPMNSEDQRAEEAMIGVWPNPANDVAWIHYPKEADNLGTIQVHDNQGRSISAHELRSNGLLELSVTGFTPGVYHIVILLEGEVIDSCKLVVQ
jgi:hypothetical protein